MREKTEVAKKSDSRKEDILKVSYELFIEQGYEKASMRQIAANAGVSLGLAAYHYKSKKEIALEIIKRKFRILSETAELYVDRTEEPILYSALLVCLNYTVFSSERFRAFYMDSLREDIFFEVIAQSGNETYMSIRDKYKPELDDEKASAMGWYGNYISVSMERTLVLYAEGKKLPGTVPEIIFKSYIDFWHFPGIDELVDDACRRSRTLTEQIISEHPELFN